MNTLLIIGVAVGIFNICNLFYNLGYVDSYKDQDRYSPTGVLLRLFKFILTWVALIIAAPLISVIVGFVYLSDIKFWKSKKATYPGLVKEILISAYYNLTSK